MKKNYDQMETQLNICVDILENIENNPKIQIRKCNNL